MAVVDIIELNLPMADRTDPQLSYNSRSGGLAIDGSEQIISPLSERWRFTAVFPIHNKIGARIIRRAKSKLKGRFNYLQLRVCDQYRITRRDIGAWSDTDPVTHSDGSFFSDGSGYALTQPKAPVTADALKNSSVVTVRASDFAGAMTAGVFFSINFSLYQVDDWELVGDNYVLQISPPLRANINTEDEADFDAVCYWRLESDDDGRLDLQIGRFGAVTLNLVEPIGR